MESTQKFPARNCFAEAYARAKGLNVGAVYAQLLERTRAHLDEVLVEIEKGERIPQKTNLLVAENPVSKDATVSAYLVALDLRAEGYPVEVTSDSSFVTGERLWLTISLI